MSCYKKRKKIYETIYKVKP